MPFLLFAVAGAVVFWALFAVWLWIFHSNLDWWALVLLFPAHWALYALMATTVRPDVVDTLGWFVLGPLLGSGWLTTRMTFAARASAPAARLSGRRLAATSLTMGMLNLLVTTGTIIPIALGLIFVVLRALGAVA